jgi:heat shock factor-binding protein 1
MADSASTAAAGEPEELTVFVQNLLQQMQARFQAMSDAIITKIDDMGGRIDELERNISELMTGLGGAGAGAGAPASAAAGGAAAGPTADGR